MSPFNQEEDVLPSRKVLLILGSTVGFGILLCIVAWLTLWREEGTIRPARHFPEARLGRPHAVENVRQGVFSLERGGLDQDVEERARLNEWKWIDREKRIARIPIDRAIDWVVEENQ